LAAQTCLCTGLRIREALRLRADDFDGSRGVLTVRQTKFRKSRLVALHPSAVASLRGYADERDRRHPRHRDCYFFVSDAGQPLPYGTVRHTFHVLLRRAMPGVRPVGRVRPRLHDLRHSFACRCLLRWYRDGTDIHQAIDRLSTYLGHAKVTDTYRYLTGVPELFALAAERFEDQAALLPGDNQ
jgi:integrase